MNLYKIIITYTLLREITETYYCVSINRKSAIKTVLSLNSTFIEFDHDLSINKLCSQSEIL